MTVALVVRVKDVGVVALVVVIQIENVEGSLSTLLRFLDSLKRNI